MSKYIVFRCNKCNKANTNEIRQQFSRDKLLRCFYCKMKGQKFPLTQVYGIFDLPIEAKNLLVKININKVEALPLDQKEILIKLGEMFVQNAQNQILPHTPKPKISDKQRIIDTMTEMKDDKGIISVENVTKRVVALGVAEEKIEKIIEDMKTQGVLISVDNREEKFKFNG